MAPEPATPSKRKQTVRTVTTSTVYALLVHMQPANSDPECRPCGPGYGAKRLPSKVTFLMQLQLQQQINIVDSKQKQIHTVIVAVTIVLVFVCQCDEVVKT
jgi:hypothetical protein